jgi:hypothetical protein
MEPSKSLSHFEKVEPLARPSKKEHAQVITGTSDLPDEEELKIVEMPAVHIRPCQFFFSARVATVTVSDAGVNLMTHSHPHLGL